MKLRNHPEPSPAERARFTFFAGLTGAAATMAVYWIPGSIGFSMELYDHFKVWPGTGFFDATRQVVATWFLPALFTIGVAAFIGLITAIIAVATREGRYEWDDDPAKIAISIGGATAASAMLLHGPVLLFAFFFRSIFFAGIILGLVAVITAIATVLAWSGARLTNIRPR